MFFSSEREEDTTPNDKRPCTRATRYQTRGRSNDLADGSSSEDSEQSEDESRASSRNAKKYEAGRRQTRSRARSHDPEGEEAEEDEDEEKQSESGGSDNEKDEDCDDQEECWMLAPRWIMARYDCTHWLPAHALPAPAGEVQPDA